MSKYLLPLKLLRQRYSTRVNRGRELVARSVVRPQDLSNLVLDAERWDHESALLAQSTFAKAAPPYNTLPPLKLQGSLEQDLHLLRANIAANVRQLELIQSGLTETSSGCMGLGFTLPGRR